MPNADTQLFNKKDTATEAQGSPTKPHQLGTDRASWGADAALVTPRGRVA